MLALRSDSSGICSVGDNDHNLGFETICACAVLRGASRSVTQLYDLVLAPTGLRATQFIILKTIHDTGEIAQCDYARKNAIAVETLSRRFGGLRRKGLVELRIGPQHGERIYALSEHGKKLLKQAMPYWNLAQRRLRNALGETDWSLMLELSERISSAAHNAEQLRTNNSLAPKTKIP